MKVYNVAAPPLCNPLPLLADLCANMKCRYGARCENGKCVCPQSCPDDNEPVCASDGETYGNECEMRRYACSQTMELEVVHSSACHDDSLSGSGGRMFTHAVAPGSMQMREMFV